MTTNFIPPPEASVTYFAYGANMTSQSLARRGIAAAGSAAQVCDPAVGLAFAHRAGYATLVATPKNSASRWQWPRLAPRAEHTGGEGHIYWQPHGVLYELTRQQLLALARSEVGYELQQIWVRRYGQDTAQPAVAFRSSWWLRLRGPVPPTERYLGLLIAGAEEHGLDPAYVAWLRVLPAVQPAALGGALYSDTPAEAAAKVAAAAALCAMLLPVRW